MSILRVWHTVDFAKSSKGNRTQHRTVIIQAQALFNSCDVAGICRHTWITRIIVEVLHKKILLNPMNATSICGIGTTKRVKPKTH